jgi:hypothetical protein
MFTKVERAQGLYKANLSPNSRELDKWLTNLLRNYIKEEEQFRRLKWRQEVGWSPTFEDTERQIATILYPALRANSKNVYLEWPYEIEVSRKKKKSRFLDYWVNDSDKVIGIEVELSWQNVIGRRPSVWTQTHWDRGIEQANKPSRLDLKLGRKPIFKLTMLIARFWQHREKNPSLSRAELKELASKCVNSICEGPRPKWVGLWLPSQKKEVTLWYNKEKKRWESYGIGALFICHWNKSLHS